jgi:dethiobiotin synthetase
VNTVSASRIIFITGTDTGVGKTVLTALLLRHLRQAGCHALAMKPFCSGSRGDAELLHDVQDGELTYEEINPFFFAEQLAPLVAARKHHLTICLPQVMQHIKHLRDRCQCLLIEGIGGLMVPLGEAFSVVDLIARLRCKTIVVSRNQLGTINHTLLTVRALQNAGINKPGTVLMTLSAADSSADSNGQILTELLAPSAVFRLPFLGANPARFRAQKNNRKIIQKTLAQILA